MPDFVARLFNAQDFMPHGHCYLWHSDILWLHVASDALIALSYYSIPLAMFVFIRRRHSLEFRWVFALFGTFILACGTTHALEILTVWTPMYRASGLMKLGTGIVSAATASLVWPLIPRALAMPSPTDLALEIAERKRAEHELRQANLLLERRVRARTEELARSNDDLRQLAAVASHDLREPLRTVRGFAQLLAEDCVARLDDTGREYLGHITSGAQRMERMIDDLLDYSSAFETSIVRVDATQALDEAVVALGAELRDVEVTRDALPHLTFPKGQLTRVLQNLLSNAAKYRSSAPLSIHVGADESSHPGFVRLFVADNGVGVPEGFEAQIFQPFRRLHTDTEIPGSGMGLAICRKLVERRGGQIWVTAQKPHGSVFSFTIPTGEE